PLGPGLSGLHHLALPRSSEAASRRPPQVLATPRWQPEGMNRRMALGCSCTRCAIEIGGATDTLPLRRSATRTFLLVFSLLLVFSFLLVGIHPVAVTPCRTQVDGS